MWLLETKSRSLEHFTNERNVPTGYAILSHTWGVDEVTFDEIHAPECKAKNGYKKIEHACEQALQDGHHYLWIDTCCIDKRSSAELSEAINSMYRWYQNAAVCYVYMVDFIVHPGSEAETNVYFKTSCWWTRGWTLQELIAPKHVRFYNYHWQYYGDKMHLAEIIAEITYIDIQVLQDSRKLRSMSVAKRMSWASRRQTSRQEDQAYALMGMFNVSMPLLYGEGGVKAFQRLQEEIIRTSTTIDHSILAWMPWEGAPQGLFKQSSFAGKYQNLLCPAPYGFRHAHNIISWAQPQAETFTLTSYGLQLSVFIKAKSEDSGFWSKSTSMALNCRYDDERMTLIMLYVEQRLRVHSGFGHGFSLSKNDTFDRLHRKGRQGNRLRTILVADLSEYRKADIILAREPFVWPAFEDRAYITYDHENYRVVDSFPADAFDAKLSMLALSRLSKWHYLDQQPACGAIVLERQDAELLQIVLTIGCWAAGTTNPRITFDVMQRTDFSGLDAGLGALLSCDSVIPGRAYKFQGPQDSVLEMVAQCYQISGELMWSVEFRDAETR